MSPELNFPEGISALVRCVEQEHQLKIWDACRKKWLVFTPEEWVRQHCIHYLNALGYPLSLMQTEGGLKTVKRTKRSDLLIYKNKILKSLFHKITVDLSRIRDPITTLRDDINWIALSKL